MPPHAPARDRFRLRAGISCDDRFDHSGRRGRLPLCHEGSRPPPTGPDECEADEAQLRGDAVLAVDEQADTLGRGRVSFRLRGHRARSQPLRQRRDRKD